MTAHQPLCPESPKPRDKKWFGEWVTNENMPLRVTAPGILSIGLAVWESGTDYDGNHASADDTKLHCWLLGSTGLSGMTWLKFVKAKPVRTS
ncbi:unnamed protein product [Notodromas monacha]|uniref:Uncharacterized protein n=1 Tax=Notodromas monacha TaxID=399045 RepID=A0A7R9BXR5_9CRUS|nr:unnamed protein product [Notodromas monacha]CAG0923313.1 unnamed protein product [Notodromas monacha]